MQLLFQTYSSFKQFNKELRVRLNYTETRSQTSLIILSRISYFQLQ